MCGAFQDRPTYIQLNRDLFEGLNYGVFDNLLDILKPQRSALPKLNLLVSGDKIQITEGKDRIGTWNIGSFGMEVKIQIAADERH
jgi:hypothetical protein